jgi:hypothetical protein
MVVMPVSNGGYSVQGWAELERGLKFYPMGVNPMGADWI